MAGAVGFGFLLLGATYLVVAGLLARQRYGSVLLKKSITATIFTAVGALSTGIAYLQASQGLVFDIPYRARTIGVLALPPIVGACYQLQRKPRIGRVLETALYVLWGGVALLSTVTTRLDGGAESLMPFVDRVGEHEQLVRALLSVTLAWSIFVLTRTYRSTHGIERRQVSYALVGMGIYTFGAGVLSASAVWLGRGAVDPAMAFVMSIPWIGLTLYGASRYRLFDVSDLFSRTLSALVLVGGAVLAAFSLHRVISPYATPAVATAVAAGLVTVPLVSGSLRSTVSASIARLLGRRAREDDDRRALNALTSALSLAELAPTIVRVARERLAVPSLALFLRREGGGFAVIVGTGDLASAVAPLSSGAAVVRWLKVHQELYIADEQLLYGNRALATSVQNELEPLAIEVAAPVAHGERLEGILCIGPKADREAFTRGELDWIHALAGRAAFAVENLRLYAALEEAMTDLDAFVRSAAHDLRTPLRAIDNLAAFANEDLSADVAAVPEHLAAIRKRALRMEALLDGIERYLHTRPGLSSSPHSSVNLGEVVHEIVRARVPEGFQVEVVLETEQVSTDAGHIAAVLDELIHNAVVHHDKGDGRIAVRARAADGQLAIRIEDDGKGVAPEYQEKIFKLFQTLERRDVTDGTGIGLAICRKIVGHHGGTIHVESRGRGAAFCFTWRLDGA